MGSEKPQNSEFKSPTLRTLSKVFGWLVATGKSMQDAGGRAESEAAARASKWKGRFTKWLEYK